MSDADTHRVSVVIPVYQGETTLGPLLRELLPLTVETVSTGGSRFLVTEVVLVHDCGPDDSGRTIASLAEAHPFVRPVWLSKNFGQHPATLAGMASSTGDWVVTIDEDGQQNPADLGPLLDTAIREGAQLVYAQPANPPPHGFVRNALSRGAKKAATLLLGNRDIGHFNSFRLVRGDIARSLAAYCGHGVFLDVALFWMTSRIGRCAVQLRREGGRPSGYSLRKLFSHFWTLLLTSGTRPLRLIAIMGFGSMVLAFAIASYAIWVKIFQGTPVQGWASLLIVTAFFSGCILMALGVIAEYMVVTMSIAMGKPLYVVAARPTAPKKKT